MSDGEGYGRLPRLRTEVLRPEVAGWPREDLARAFATRGMSPEEAEDFLGWINRNVAPRLGDIAAGAAKGATAGSVVPGWGTALGALGGAVIGGIGSGGSAPDATARVGTGPAGGTASGSVSALLARLAADPNLQSALLNMALGKGLAKPTTQLSTGEEIPVEAFAEAIHVLSEAALAEYAESGSGEPEAESREDIEADDPRWRDHRYAGNRSRWLDGPRRHGMDVRDPMLRTVVLADLLRRSGSPAPTSVTQVSYPAAPQPPYAGSPVQPPYPGSPVATAPSPYPDYPPQAAPAGPGIVPEPGWSPGYTLPDLAPRSLSTQPLTEAWRRAEAEYEFELAMESLDEGW